MRAHGHAQWGWHRLTDRFAEEIVRAAELAPNDLVLDVGAGKGALTAQLAVTGARVIAFELHPERVVHLRRRFEAQPRVKVVRGDVSDLWLPGRPFHVVANPPFAATTALLKRLLSPASVLVSAHLVLQRGAARRFAQSGRDARFEFRVERMLPRSAFVPSPKVDTAVLSIRRRA